MEPCCYSHEYADEFGPKSAQAAARRYRRKGLEGHARVLAEAVEGLGVEGASLLEVGGGLGGLHVHLLERGAATATNVELSPEWEGEARRLLDERGLSERVARRNGDFVATADEVEPADVVLLHRVVCCYPHWSAFLDRVTEKAERLLGLTFPRDRTTVRGVIGFGNLLQRARGREFRAFVHPADEMVARIEAAGFRPVFDGGSAVWRSMVFERAATS